MRSQCDFSYVQGGYLVYRGGFGDRKCHFGYPQNRKWCAKYAILRVSEMALPVLETKIWDHFYRPNIPPKPRKITLGTHLCHSKVFFWSFRSIILGRALQQLLKETVKLIASANTVRKGNIEETFTLINCCASKRIEWGACYGISKAYRLWLLVAATKQKSQNHKMARFSSMKRMMIRKLGEAKSHVRWLQPLSKPQPNLPPEIKLLSQSFLQDDK